MKGREEGPQRRNETVMQMTGQYRIEASRQAVWEALNDVEVLRACIPGVEEIEKTSDTSFAAKVRAKVGPVSARFAGEVTLSDLDPPNGYTIAGEGKGGAAGFAKGGAKVRLEPDGTGTLMHYEVHADIGGKLAQLGSRLIDGTAKKMAKDFFETFAGLVDGKGMEAAEAEEAAPAAPQAEAEAPEAAPEPAPEPAAAAAPAPEPEPEPQATPQPAPEPAPAPQPEKSGGLSPMVWVAGVILLAAVAVLISLS